MAAPEFVPAKPLAGPRSYHSTPRRPRGWQPVRPGEVVTVGQPQGDRLGRPGPDQGYVLRLARAFEERVHLAPGEAWADARTVAAVVALKRASLFGRAPIAADLEVGFTLFGYLDEQSPADLLALRTERLAEVHSPHHYVVQRTVADSVADEVLRLPLAEVTSRHRAGWADLVDAHAIGH